MKTFSIQSGSCGNCYYYESGDVRLFFDAGIPMNRALERMRVQGVEPSSMNGLFISHDHSDHTCGAGVFQRRFQMPVFCAPDTHRVIANRLGKVPQSMFEYFVPGDRVKIGHVTVTTIPTPHDAANPCMFIVDDGRTRVGILTDLGHCFSALRKCLATLDVVYLESNYDATLLERNPNYPERLKKRISSNRGHLENTEAAEMVRDNAGDRLRVLLLSHLSQDNNNPGLAVKTHRTVLKSRPDLDIQVAPRDRASNVITREMVRSVSRGAVQLSLLDCLG